MKRKQMAKAAFCLLTITALALALSACGGGGGGGGGGVSATPFMSSATLKDDMDLGSVQGAAATPTEAFGISAGAALMASETKAAGLTLENVAGASLALQEGSIRLLRDGSLLFQAASMDRYPVTASGKNFNVFVATGGATRQSGVTAWPLWRNDNDIAVRNGVANISYTTNVQEVFVFSAMDYSTFGYWAQLAQMDTNRGTWRELAGDDVLKSALPFYGGVNKATTIANGSFQGIALAVGYSYNDAQPEKSQAVNLRGTASLTVGNGAVSVLTLTFPDFYKLTANNLTITNGAFSDVFDKVESTGNNTTGIDIPTGTLTTGGNWNNDIQGQFYGNLGAEAAGAYRLEHWIPDTDNNGHFTAGITGAFGVKK